MLWPLLIDAVCDAAGGMDASALARLPSAPGVLAMEAADGMSVLVAATGDLRAFAAARVGERPDGASGAGRPDLRPVVARVRAATVGGALEADLAVLELARERLPSVYRALTDRSRAWFVHLDPEADAPAWRKTNGLGEDGSRPDHLLGPVRDKDTAGRLGETIDDAFDLCRFPRELARAPAGQVCAYFEMGRCPGPCAGREPMEAFRSRVRAAVRAMGAGRADEAADAVARMRAAAERRDFEAAAAWKARGEAIARLDAGAFRHAGPMERLALLLVLPSERAGHARVIAFVGGAMVPVAEVDAARAGAAWEALGGEISAMGAVPFPAEAAAFERLGLIVRHWLRGPGRGRRRRAAVLDLRGGGLGARAFGAAVRGASEPGDAGAEVEEHELGG